MVRTLDFEVVGDQVDGAIRDDCARGSEGGPSEAAPTTRRVAGAVVPGTLLGVALVPVTIIFIVASLLGFAAIARSIFGTSGVGLEFILRPSLLVVPSVGPVTLITVFLALAVTRRSRIPII